MTVNLNRNLNQLKKDFPAFQIHKDLVYLDSAASTFRPECVNRVVYEYSSYNHANIHRGAYSLSYEATKSYDEAKSKVATFIGADEHEVIFTYGTTDSLNFISSSLGTSGVLQEGDEVVISIFEHHSNIVPWQQLRKQKKIKLTYLYDFTDESLAKITERTKVVSFTMMSNATGFVPPAQKIIEKAHSVGAIVIADAAQYVSHDPVDVKTLDVDFMAFSGHKMFGPTGIGVLYGKRCKLEHLMPYRFGGDMIEYVQEQETTFAAIDEKFEAGTPNIDGVIGFGAAVDYINEIGIRHISEYLKNLRAYAVNRLREIPDIKLVEDVLDQEKYPDGEFGPVIAFTVEGAHPHDVASILDASGIAIRAGHHCAQPLMKYLKQPATCRVSLQLYNTKEDIDYLITKFEEVRRWLNLGS